MNQTLGLNQMVNNAMLQIYEN